MLKTIMAIAGKPGLYKLISQGKNIFYVESFTDQKRFPVHSRDKVVSLGDIAIYTEKEEVSLSAVLENIKAKENGEKAAIAPTVPPNELMAYMSEILPNFDRDRVYPSDIRKLIKWYNQLIEVGMTDFSKKEETEKTGETGDPQTVKEAEATTE